MFSLEFQVMSEYDIVKLREFMSSVDSIFQGICEAVKVGASYLCAPNSSTMLVVYMNVSNLKETKTILRVDAEDASYAVSVVSELNERLKRIGFHMNLESSFMTSK